MSMSYCTDTYSNRSEDEPDILKEAAISRGVMEMATGMEKEEEEVCYLQSILQFFL